MLMVSSCIVSRPFGVILTARKAVFIWGETEVIVPWSMVPVSCITIISHSVPAVRRKLEEDRASTILEFNCNCLIRTFH